MWLLHSVEFTVLTIVWNRELQRIGAIQRILIFNPSMPPNDSSTGQQTVKQRECIFSLPSEWLPCNLQALHLACWMQRGTDLNQRVWCNAFYVRNESFRIAMLDGHYTIALFLVVLGLSGSKSWKSLSRITLFRIEILSQKFEPKVWV